MSDASLDPELASEYEIICNIINFVYLACTVLPYFGWAAFSSLRVYAISDRTLWMAMLVLSLSFMPIATNIYNYTQYVSLLLPPPINCTTTNTDANFNLGGRDPWLPDLRRCLRASGYLVANVPDQEGGYRGKRSGFSRNVDTTRRHSLLRVSG
ncbi:hypothetical protein A0H81_07302 [Grifola frondosa]|uniref:Uncharacterized protein n=1 Tax=Grifola frondosa TaxID=5627 RepID=A0A1C7M8C3_GRIFR|nr:hypothetical protein A0H81_07302 [Grifola frondosa]